MGTTWDFDGYWNTVLGASRNAADVVREFALTDEPAAGPGSLDEWLGNAEGEAWSAGGTGGDMPDEWAGFHAKALAQLKSACEATA